MSVYDISGTAKPIRIEAGSSTTTDLTVTNTGTLPSTGLISVNNRAHPDAAWLSYVHDPQRQFEPGASGIIRLGIQTTDDATPGESIVNVLVANEHNPDEEFVTYDLVLRIDPKPEKKKRPWWHWLVLAALILFGILILWAIISLVRGTTTEVPNVLGKRYEVAAQTIEDASLQAVLVPTSLEDLDSESFQRRAPKLIERIIAMQQLQAAQASAADPDSETNDEDSSEAVVDDTSDLNLDDPIDDFAPLPEPEIIPDTTEDALTAPSDIHYERIADRLVWDQIAERVMERGTAIPLKVVPELVDVPMPEQFVGTAIAQHLANYGMRFEMHTGLPSGYRYGDGRDGQPRFEPALGQLFKGTKITVWTLPQTLRIPQFTAMDATDLPLQSQFNFTYVYHYSQRERKTTQSWQEVAQWIDIQRRHQLSPYVYRQAPAPGAEVPRDKHKITVFIDLRRTNQ